MTPATKKLVEDATTNSKEMIDTLRAVKGDTYAEVVMATTNMFHLLDMVKLMLCASNDPDTVPQMMGPLADMAAQITCSVVDATGLEEQIPSITKDVEALRDMSCVVVPK